LSATTISEADFNVIYIYIHDEVNRLKTQHPNIDSAEFKAAVSLSTTIDEVRNIRSSFGSSTGSGISPAGPSITSSTKLSEVLGDIIRGLRTRIYEYQHSVPKAAQSANAV
jgi:hypothetical protein